MLGDEIVITGLGAVTPLGGDVTTTWGRLIKGESAIEKDPLDGCLKARISGPGFTREQQEKDSHKKHLEILRRAVSEAIAASGVPRDSAGLFLLCQSKPLVGIFENFSENLPGGYGACVASDFNFKNKIVKNIVAACSGGIQAVYSAVISLMSGVADFAVIGVAETSIYPLYTSAFKRMGVLARRKMMPFDCRREGFAIGEGAAAVVIEKKTSVSPLRRGKILARIEGIYSGASSKDILDIGEDPDAIVRAIWSLTSEGASKEKAVLPDVDYIHAHGTATRSNDAAEALAITRVFENSANGDFLRRKVSVSSTKAATGHLLGASGILGLIFAVCAIKDKKIPPTLNLEEPVTQDIDFTPVRYKVKNVKRAMALAYGFGSQVGAVLVGELRL